MKTKAMIFIFLTCIVYSYGQHIQNIGFKGGVSFATMSYKYYYSNFNLTINQKNDFKAGIYSAITADFFTGKYVSLTTDLGFVQKGMIRKIPPDFVDSTGEYSYNKINRDHVCFTPMLKGFYKLNVLTMYALVGPRIDFDVSFAMPPESTMNSKNPRWLFGLSYGLGIEYRKEKFGILVESQGHPDIIPTVYEKAPSGSSYELTVKQNAFILTAGLKYYFQ